MKNPFIISMSLLLSFCTIAACSTVVQAADLLGPVAVVPSRDGGWLFVANAEGRQVAVISVAEQKVVAAMEMPAEPTALALSADGQRLYVACAAPRSTVCIIDTAARKTIGSIPAGHTASALALSADGKRLYVCNRFNNDVSVIDVSAAREIARIPAVREPIGVAVASDGRSVFVINHLPQARADTGDVATVVSVFDTAAAEQAGANKTASVATIPLPNGTSGVRGLCLSPDGKQLYVSHILSRYQMPTTQLDRGWMNTNALTIIDAQAKKYLNTVLLDDIDRGAANPWGIGVTADSRTICVAHAGTQELSIINASGLLEKLQKLADGSNKAPSAAGNYGSPGSVVPADVPNDLSFLVGLRRRIHLPGIGPRGVAVIGSTAFVAEFFTDTLATVDLQSDTTRQIALGAKPQLSPSRRGQMLFQNADLCFQRWQSCESCHPDGRADSLNWDLMNDGIGNPKNTRSMLRSAPAGPVMALGVRENTESAVRAGITHIQFAVRPDEEAQAIDAYLKSIRPVPSPHLIDGKLSPSAERGKRLFFDKRTGCASCHAEPGYADGKMHDVGSSGPNDKPGSKFTTPSLVETWRTAPYLHDGRYLTIKELIVQGKHVAGAGELDKLSEQEVNDLIEFVLSL